MEEINILKLYKDEVDPEAYDEYKNFIHAKVYNEDEENEYLEFKTILNK